MYLCVYVSCRSLRQWIAKHKKQTVKTIIGHTSLNHTSSNHTPSNHASSNHTPLNHTPLRNYILESPLPYTPPNSYTPLTNYYTPPSSFTPPSVTHNVTLPSYSLTTPPLRSTTYYTPSTTPYTPSSYYTPPSFSHSSPSLRPQHSSISNHSPSVPSFYNDTPKRVSPSSLLPLLSSSLSPSTSRYSSPLQLLINATILRPCHTWSNFKFDTDAILRESFKDDSQK